MVQSWGFTLPLYVRMKFIFSQTHITRIGSRQYSRLYRSRPFVVAIDRELRRIMALSTAPRPAYQRINPPNNRWNIGVCDWQPLAQVGYKAHDSSLPRAQTCRETTSLKCQILSASIWDISFFTSSSLLLGFVSVRGGRRPVYWWQICGQAGWRWCRCPLRSPRGALQRYVGSSGR